METQLDDHPPSFSQTCENNKPPILGTLREIVDSPGTVLEVGGGGGPDTGGKPRHAGKQPAAGFYPTPFD